MYSFEIKRQSWLKYACWLWLIWYDYDVMWCDLCLFICQQNISTYQDTHCIISWSVYVIRIFLDFSLWQMGIDLLDIDDFINNTSKEWGRTKAIVLNEYMYVFKHFPAEKVMYQHRSNINNRQYALYKFSHWIIQHVKNPNSVVHHAMA